jgi:hypothetical protein
MENQDNQEIQEKTQMNEGMTDETTDPDSEQRRDSERVRNRDHYQKVHS